MKHRALALLAAICISVPGMFIFTPANAVGYVNCHKHMVIVDWPKVRDDTYCDFKTSLYTTKHIRTKIGTVYTFGK